jgi:predicted small secreted protein
MNPFQPALVVVAAVQMLAVTACHNTWQGVKTDTRRALDKTGQKVEKEGDKIGGHPNDGR